MKLKLKSILMATLMLGTSADTFAQLTGGAVKEHNIGEFTYQKNKKHRQPTEAKSKPYGTFPKRPDHLNNALLKYFPPIFSQDQGSCDAASYIGYQWTYERNNYYGLDGSFDENRFTSHFNFLLAHNYQGTGKHEMLQHVGNPSAADYGGQTYSKYFGNQNCKDPDYGWMQGYNKWYNAAHNRDWTTSNIEQSVMTEEGREILKQWLYNHNGDYDFNAGGVAWFGMAATDMSIGDIGSTPTNRQIGVVGKRYVADWGPDYNHAQTIVGYDDRIEFDLDSNGVYGEKDKDEVGAWIIANSWGNNWEDHGFVYCPYARSVETSSRRWEWTVTRHHIRKDYEPLRMLKAKLAYSHRSMIALSVTATQDTASQIATDSLPMHHFQYAGDGTRNTFNPPATPMLGKWIDGLHHEPMEFGYDITELTKDLDRRKPIKYFFNILTRNDIPEDKCGTGKLYGASIVDYELDKEGIEFPFKVENVQITGSGKLYRVSVVVPGEQINAPSALQITEGGALAWQKPTTTSMPVKKYYIYNNDIVIDSVDADTYEYTPAIPGDKSYCIAAVYQYRNNTVVSDPTNPVMFPSAAQGTDNAVINMQNTMASVDGVGFKATNGATLEYWIKPRTSIKYTNQIGNPIYFISGISQNKNAMGGYGITRVAEGSYNTVNLNEWNHVAVVIDGTIVTVYVNGKKTTSRDYYFYSECQKVKAFDNFFIGRDEQNGLVNAELDEIRLWNRALDSYELIYNYKSEIANPAQQDDLVLYYKGDTFEEDGKIKLRDYARGRHAVVRDIDSIATKADNSFLTGDIISYASIANPTETVYANAPMRFYATTPASSTNVKWYIDKSDSVAGIHNSPYITFATAGTHTLSMTATNASGKETTINKTITVEELPAPVADFTITENNLPASEYFNFVNRSSGINCTYKWTMEGADINEVFATNAAARFLEVGTYPVTLTVSNAAGTSSITKEVTAIVSAPYVDFNIQPSAILLGDKVFFQDKTIYSPEKWQWEINHVNGKHNYMIHAQNTAFTPEAPGYYNVTLKATNPQGETSKTMRKAFAVSNADPMNALSMTGSGERFVIPSPVTSPTRAFTIDTWLYAANIKSALTMSTDDGGFKIWTNQDGSVGVQVNGKQVVSTPGYIIKDEWHHYAVTFSTGNVKFYRDAELYNNPTLRLNLTCPAWNGNLTFSSDTASFKGIIDEYRIWTKALTVSQLQSYSNQPIAPEDLDLAKSKDGLQVYYQFNQNSGNIQDASGYDRVGIRQGFGPDGDAWTSALGVFTLDFSGEDISDVSDQFLTNYKAPFLHTDNSVSTNNSSNLFELKTGTDDSKWVIGNAVETDKATTGAHVFKTQNYAINFRTGYYSFADTLINHQLYQTTTLPAGYYTLKVSPSAGGTFKTDSSYLCVVRGDEFVDMSNFEEKSLVYAPLSSQSVNFTVGEDEDVTIGVLINLKGWTAIDIAEFNLMRTPVIVVEPDDATSVYDAVESGSMKRYTPMTNAIRVINRERTPMRVYTLDGRLVFDEIVEGVHIIPFAPGIYIVDGEKIQVK